MAVTFNLAPGEAQRLGLDYVDMFISDWGQVPGTSVYASTSPVLALPSVTGIAIHPQSDIDRVLVGTNVGVSDQLGGAGGGSIVVTETLRIRQVEVSVDAPMICAAPSVFPASSSPKQLTLTAHPDQLWGLTYLKQGSAAPAVFGPDSGGWVSPLLGLRLYIRPVLFGPQGRAPFNHPIQRTNYGGVNGQLSPVTLGGGGAEQLLNIYPSHGRKSVRFSWRPTGTAVVTVRIAVLDFFQPRTFAYERNIATVAGIAADNSKWVEFVPQSDFVLVYYTLTAGAGDLMFSYRASDDPIGATITGP